MAACTLAQAAPCRKVQGGSSDLLTVLRVRGIAVLDAVRGARKKDAARLERRHERAIGAPSVDDVLDEPS